MTRVGCVMSRPWWWEAVSCPSGKECGRIEAKNADGRTVASVPYQLTRRGPFTAMLLPQLTQTSHIRVEPGSDRVEALRALIGEIKKFMRERRVLMAQVADYMTRQDEQTLASEGFKMEPRVSYRIAPVDIATAIDNFTPGKRRKYRKAAAANFSLRQDMTPDELYSALEEAFGKVKYPRELLTTLANAAIGRGCGVILQARDSQGEHAAAVFLAYDDESLYYMAPTISPAHRQDGANEWLTVKAMEYAFERGLTFDFEGSVIPGIARSYRHFGGVAAHYTLATLYRDKLTGWIIRTIKHL